jgi:hypothetical protein
MRHDSHLLPGPVAFKKPLSLFLTAALLMGPVSPGFAREDRFPGARNEFNDPQRTTSPPSPTTPPPRSAP